MTRADGRRPDELRPVKMVAGVQVHAEGSVQIDWGRTRVLCAASVEDGAPPFREASGGGWVTAEYGMLPRSTTTRKARRTGGRETEIQRLIGRALRASLDLDALGPRTITIDCDVLQADGGTRVASVTGGYVALALAVRRLRAAGQLSVDPMREPVAAVSVGLVGGQALLDLEYGEDSKAEVDMNLVMTGGGRFVEVQGTAEGRPFDGTQLAALLELGRKGVTELCALQQRTLAEVGS